eukprot:2968072-Prymnesium_polylepis.1
MRRSRSAPSPSSESLQVSDAVPSHVTGVGSIPNTPTGSEAAFDSLENIETAQHADMLFEKQADSWYYDEKVFCDEKLFCDHCMENTMQAGMEIPQELLKGSVKKPKIDGVQAVGLKSAIKKKEFR